MKHKTRVVYRIFKQGGDVIALFPDIPADNSGHLCSSYQHIGQHGGADIQCVIKQTCPATFRERYELREELLAIGYRLQTYLRIPADAQQRRQG